MQYILIRDGVYQVHAPKMKYFNGHTFSMATRKYLFFIQITMNLSYY